jgi:hypothetical protein
MAEGRADAAGYHHRVLANSTSSAEAASKAEFDERRSSKQRTGETSCMSLVPSTGRAIELLRRCWELMAALKKSGLLKQAAKQADAASSN